MLTRRNAVKSIVVGAATLAVPLTSRGNTIQPDTDQQLPMVRKGRINHSVCRWTYNNLSLDELCIFAKQIGINAIDLVGAKDWDTLRKHGMDSSMCNGAEINLVDGWNNPQFHSTLVQSYSTMIPLVGLAGYKNLICFSGNRRGMDDETGLKNCAEGLKKIIGIAEKNKVVIQMELFNSKVDHKDYMCDNTAWGIALCKAIGSENFKLLYDIYHMQINEGDIIHTIKENHQYFGHYHTAGVPGRHEIDESQELNYPAIMRAIADTGFKGYVAQEFIPTANDKLVSLSKAIDICDV